MIKILRVLFIVLFLALFVSAFLNPAKPETNILKAVLQENQKSELIINLSNQFSSKINVLIEADEEKTCETISKDFVSKIDNEFFKIKKVDYASAFKMYEKYNQNFLSTNTRTLLLNKDYEVVKQQAFERLINPIGFSVLPLEKDPFLLFTDYLMSLSSNSQIGSTINYNDKYYMYLSLELGGNSLSPTVINEKIKELIKVSEEYDKIYLTGVPIHSYYASSKSIIEINVICVLSTIFLIALFFFYFRNLKLMLPAFLSLTLGMAGGYSLVSLLFDKVHVLTFVFSTTLIGICIDYSLHYFIEKDLKKIIKSLTVGLLTTCSAFVVLTFSGMELLKQISLFTIMGLASVYSFIVLFYPLICKNIFKDYERKISFNIKYKKIVLAVLLFVIVLGFLKLKFNDDIKNMYIPSKKLLYAERLFSDVTKANHKTSFAIVEGKNIEEILQKEEVVADSFNEYQAISKYIPSKKRQLENLNLREELYKKSLEEYASFLTVEQKKNLLNVNKNDLIEYDNSSLLSEFMFDKNKSIMVLYNAENKEYTMPEGVEYIDLKTEISSKIKDYREQCISLLLPILLMLLGVLSFIYRNFVKAVRIVVPSLFAATFSIGFTSLLSPINMFHILAIFLIVGFGLDYSIFRASGVKNSTSAVFLSCATSVFSFLLLAFTSFKLISSLGVILSVGLLTSYILSLVLIPKAGLDENKESI
ncbi:MAG: hypothetical protein IJY61_09090 [Candidatus Gastranaerophilales bacterium]|nr:hypothetical protein [Candidatus Gastranaerophilales bacterium]